MRVGYPHRLVGLGEVAVGNDVQIRGLHRELAFVRVRGAHQAHIIRQVGVLAVARNHRGFRRYRHRGIGAAEIHESWRLEVSRIVIGIMHHVARAQRVAREAVGAEAGGGEVFHDVVGIVPRFAVARALGRLHLLVKPDRHRRHYGEQHHRKPQRDPRHHSMGSPTGARACLGRA